MSKCVELSVYPAEIELLVPDVLQLAVDAEDSVIEVMFEDNVIYVTRP